MLVLLTLSMYLSAEVKQRSFEHETYMVLSELSFYKAQSLVKTETSQISPYFIVIFPLQSDIFDIFILHVLSLVNLAQGSRFNFLLEL